MSTVIEKAEPLQECAERLRMTLPLMSGNCIPASPENYAVWYHYVTGDKPGLSQRIDQMLANKTPFTEEINEELFKKYVFSCNTGRLQQMREQIQSILLDASSSLNSTTSNTDHYSSVLKEFNDTCSSATSLQDVLGLVSAVIDETEQMHASVEEIRHDFAAKSQEMEELKRELEAVKLQATIDALTGLTNRGTFFDQVEECVQSAPKHPCKLSLVLLDIDHFKRVNDTYGHLVGDKVIRFVAEVLRRSIKGQDTAARYGGEEFALLLPETPLDGAVILTDRIRTTIANTNLVRTDSKEPLGQITVSAGIAHYRMGESADDLVERADRALYRSKENGRNRVTTDSA